MVIQTGHGGFCKIGNGPRVKAEPERVGDAPLAVLTCRRTPGRLALSGALIFEVLMAMTIVIIAVIPLSYTLTSDARLFRVTYQGAVAMEIVDGEIEILAAGGWRDIPEGSRPYTVHANAAGNLPPGQFVLTRAGNHLRLEWSPAKKSGIGPIVREVTVK
jgi:hypothetical protein